MTTTVTYLGGKYRVTERCRNESLTLITIKPQPPAHLRIKIAHAAAMLRAQLQSYRYRQDAQFLKACGIVVDLPVAN